MGATQTEAPLGTAAAAVAAPRPGNPVGAILVRIAGSGAWSLLAHGLAAAAAFAGTVIVARVLGPGDLGRYSVAVWVLTVVPTLMALGMPTALTKMTAESTAAGVSAGRGALAFVCRLHVLVSIAAGAVFTALALSGRLPSLLAVVLSIGIAATILQFDLEAFLAGVGRFRVLAAVSALAAVVQVGLAATGVLIGASWQGFVALFVAAGVLEVSLIGLVARRQTARLPVHRLHRSERNSLVRFAAAMSLAVVVDAVLWGRPELALLQRFRDDSDVGLYSASLRLASLAAFLPLVAARPLLTEFSALRGAGRVADLRQLFPRVCAVSMAVTAPLALGGAAIAPALVSGFFGSRYSGADTVTTLLFAGALVNALAGPATAGVVTGPRPRLIAEAGIATAVLNLVIDLALIPPFGAMGAAIATVGIQVGAVTFGTTYCWRWLGLAYPVRAAAGLVGAAAVAAVGAGLVSHALTGLAGVAGGVLVGAVIYLSILAAARMRRRTEIWS